MMSWNESYPACAGICICKAGANSRHDQDFTVDRPHGFANDGVFLHFTSAIRLRDSSAMRVCKPGACIVYTPHSPYFYTAHANGFSANWFHFSGLRTLPLLLKYAVPLNTVFYPFDPGFIEPMIDSMVTELERKMPHWEKALSLYFELFVLGLARSRPVIAHRKANILRSRMKSIRQAIQEHPENFWSVDKMAQGVAMSRSRLFSCYKQIYGISPKEDVARLRLQRAAWLLANEPSQSIKEITASIGMHDPAYFTRLFARYFKLAPGEYRRKHEN